MANFLEPGWFEIMNQHLGALDANQDLADSDAHLRVVIHVVDAPATLPNALTLSVDGTTVQLEPTESPLSDVTVLLTYDDAAAISSGTLRSSQALREGRLKVRGDVNALVRVASSLAAARSALLSESE